MVTQPGSPCEGAEAIPSGIPPGPGKANLGANLPVVLAWEVI